MIIMKKDATQEEIDNVIAEVKNLGLRADVSRGESLTIIGLVGDERKVSFSHLAVMPGVKEARMIETPYKLISREYSEAFQDREESRVIHVSNVEIGGETPVYIAGPCAIESKAQLFRIAEEVKRAAPASSATLATSNIFILDLLQPDLVFTVSGMLTTLRTESTICATFFGCRIS